MNETAGKSLNSLSRYSVWCAIFGIISYLFFFPNGIYYCFFLGVMAVAAGILFKKSGSRSVGSTVGILLGIFDILLSLMAFYGLYIIYSSLSDPVMGPRITAMIIRILEQSGLTLEQFIRVMY